MAGFTVVPLGVALLVGPTAPLVTGTKFHQELVWQHRFTGHRAGMPQTNMWTGHDLRDVAGPVDIPLLVLYGEADFYMPEELVKLTQRAIPNCEVRKLDGIGDYPMVKDPEGISAIIAEHVRKNVPDGS